MRLELYDYFKENDNSFPRGQLIDQAKKQGYSEYDINEVVLAIATGKVPSEAGPAPAASAPSSPAAVPPVEPISKEKDAQKDLFTSSPSESSAETVVDTIGSSKWGNDSYELFFTQKRIIVAKIGGSFWWYFWLGWIGQLISMSVANNRRKELMELTPESILKSDPKNVEFPYPQIIRANLKKPGFLSPARLEIESSIWKKFTLENKKSYEKALKLCQQYLENVLKVK